MSSCRVVIMLAFLCVVASLSAQTFIRGDANDDARLDLSDAVTIILQLFGDQGLPLCRDRSDANDDGRINIADPVAILTYLFARGTPPPLPFPGPGEDTTPDPLCCGPRCNPDLTGTWSGTFIDETEGEYVVVFEVEDTDAGTVIVRGLESIGNQIVGGQLFFWAGLEDRRLAFDYATTFDLVEGDFTLSEDGNRMEQGTFSTTSATEGTFTMVRVSTTTGLNSLGAGARKIAFVDLDDTTGWGGRLVLEADGCVASGNVALTPLVVCESRFTPSDDPEDILAGVHTGLLIGENGYRVSMLGLLGADSGYLSGVFTDSLGTRGFFLTVPLD